MTSLVFLPSAIVWLMAIVIAVAQGGEHVKVEELPMVVTFVNETPDTSIELFWENEFTGERRTEGTIAPRGGFLEVHTFVGHEFSYDLHGARHYVASLEPNSLGQQFAVIAGDSGSISVRCELERNFRMEAVYSPFLEITVKPYWAPRGASRFLELVRQKYYDGVVLNRVVPQFLIQFGIAKDYEQRMEWDEKPLLDDFPETERSFEPGFISFAGNGPDSRTAEIFIVMPGTSQEQLDYFGTNSWETPFAFIAGPVDSSVLPMIYDGYGDMPPWGHGPDSDKIYDVDGYTTYLPEKFPKLDYIDRCFIVGEELGGDLSAEL